MPKKKATTKTAEVLPAALPTPLPITDIVEKNYMTYVMSVIISRAIPEIDGLKPSHRRILYTMYKMGLMTGDVTKSAKVVGQTMNLNPHGDAAIYETLVRLTRGNAALLHPFVESKGTFGKHYSEMAYAASRYTNVKLDAICRELFGGIDKNAVDFVDNYDSTMTEPVLLPVSFPNILVSPNMGIAVGMASKICSFNLAEICAGTIALLKNPQMDVDLMLDIVKAPDFSGGGAIIYKREQLAEIYKTGRGSFKIRGRYTYDKAANCVDIFEIPYTTTVEIILKRIVDLVREGKLKEVSDVRDEIGKDGFRLTIDLRRGTDPDKLMAKLFKLTTLEDDFACNFNVLIDSQPRQLGLIDLMSEWIKFRLGCIKREFMYDLEDKKAKLHLLLGLGKVLLDIDLAIKIVRESESDSDVVPNLMAGFGVDKIQAEYIAEIRLRHLNREYILNRIKEIEDLQKEIERLTDLIGSESKLKKVIIEQLEQVSKKHQKPRQTIIIYDHQVEEFDEREQVENFPVRFVLTQDGYFKKITHKSLVGNDEQHLKEGDVIIQEFDGENVQELLFFTNKAQCYKARAADFDQQKASALGDFVPAKLSFDAGESVLFVKSLTEYSEQKHMVFIFENGKGVRVPISAYETKTNRKKLTGAYSEISPPVGIFHEDETFDLLLQTSDGKGAMIKSDLISIKTTRSSQGVALVNLRKGAKLVRATAADSESADMKLLRKIKVPATPVPLPELDVTKQQIKLI